MSKKYFKKKAYEKNYKTHNIFEQIINFGGTQLLANGNKNGVFNMNDLKNLLYDKIDEKTCGNSDKLRNYNEYNRTKIDNGYQFIDKNEFTVN